MDEIYKKYFRLVYNYLYSLTSNVEIAEEITQETFYKAIKGIKKFRNECSINVWLCQIAKNIWRDYMKKESKVKIVSLDDKDIENLFIEYDINSNSEMMELYKEIHKLDEMTRKVFYLRIKGELTFKEIGDILGKSEEWSKVTFYRGKVKLKEELKDDKK